MIPKNKKEVRIMEEKKFDLHQLYIVDFAKSLVHRKNIYALIYLLLNVVIITFLMQMFESNLWLCLLYGILLYAVTATIALSPVGEWLFRLFNGCELIEDPAIRSRLEPLFQEVKERAKSQQSEFQIDDKIALYICDDSAINAFAMGRRTVCVTKGLLSLSDEQIKGILGHEFGHLATHDTDLTLLITVGNFIISAFVTFIRVMLIIYNFIVSIISAFAGEGGILINIMQAIASVVTAVCINGLMWLWTQLGIVLVMKSSRDAEFEADAFSCRLGYAQPLVSAFRVLLAMEGPSEKKKGVNNIFAALSASHPETSKRIARIEERERAAAEAEAAIAQ